MSDPSLELSADDLNYVREGLTMVLRWYEDVQSDDMEDWSVQIEQVRELIRRVSPLN